jgi:hypothetical protein
VRPKSHPADGGDGTRTEERFDFVRPLRRR